MTKSKQSTAYLIKQGKTATSKEYLHINLPAKLYNVHCQKDSIFANIYAYIFTCLQKHSGRTCNKIINDGYFWKVALREIGRIIIYSVWLHISYFNFVHLFCIVLCYLNFFIVKGIDGEAEIVLIFHCLVVTEQRSLVVYRVEEVTNSKSSLCVASTVCWALAHELQRLA